MVGICTDLCVSLSNHGAKQPQRVVACALTTDERDLFGADARQPHVACMARGTTHGGVPLAELFYALCLLSKGAARGLCVPCLLVYFHGEHVLSTLIGIGACGVFLHVISVAQLYVAQHDGRFVRIGCALLAIRGLAHLAKST